MTLPVRITGLLNVHSKDVLFLLQVFTQPKETCFNHMELTVLKSHHVSYFHDFLWSDLQLDSRTVSGVEQREPRMKL